MSSITSISMSLFGGVSYEKLKYITDAFDLKMIESRIYGVELKTSHKEPVKFKEECAQILVRKIEEYLLTMPKYDMARHHPDANVPLFGKVRIPTKESTPEQLSLFVQWWMNMYKLRLTATFKEHNEMLEFVLFERHLLLNHEVFLQEYWSFVLSFIVKAHNEQHKISYEKNHQPIYANEWNDIISRCNTNEVSTIYTSQLYKLFPQSDWTLNFFTECHTCSGPYFKGVIQNNTPNFFKRHTFRDDTRTYKSSRQRQIRMQDLCYKMIRGSMAWNDKLEHKPELQGCKCPDGYTCLNPYCYEIKKPQRPKKRIRTREMTEEQQAIADDFMKEHPWVGRIIKKMS